jgi:predicted ribosome quality control (RQC) complex YloA/Tae2 family protein
LLEARVLPWERVMILDLSDQKSLILKMHGARANVMLRVEGQIVELFANDREEDWEYVAEAGPYTDPGELDLSLEKDADLRAVQRSLQQVSRIFDKQFARWVQQEMQAGQSLPEALEASIRAAQKPLFFLHREQRKVRFYLFEPVDKEDAISVEGIVPALQLFLASHFQYDNYWRSYQQVKKEVLKPCEKYEKVYASYSESIHKLEHERSPEELGHILMANLHQLKTGQKVAELDDLYGEGKVKIKLKEKLSPVDNAANYYDKHKQRKGKLKYLKSQLDDIRQKLEEARENKKAFDALPEPEALPFGKKGFDTASLREYRKELRHLAREKKEEEGSKTPFRTFRYGEYDIFIGRNARNNDLLSFKFANKEDLWLHAKDVTGSHVIVRQRPGQNVPASVLEYAAGLAAYYSKRRNDSLVPVQYTPRKYIRKRKGDPPGLVVVEREEVIMAEPVKG